jgi:branched-chain amino acid transport system substrate-binding protein
VHVTQFHQSRLVFSILATIVLATISSCRHGEQAALKNESIIKIGYFGDLSGPTFNFGQSAKNGILMAADEINQVGGINGRRIDVVIEDDQGSPERAASMISKLITHDRVVAVIAGGASGNSLAAAPRAQAAKIPLIAPSSTDPSVTQTGDYIFRTCFIDAFQGDVMAKFAVNELKAKTAAIMVNFNSPYSRGLSEFFEMSFRELGGAVVSKQSYNQGDPEFKGQLSAIKAASPDVICIPGYYGDVALIAKEARQLGLSQPLLGGDGWDAPELWQLGGDALNNSYISDHYSSDDPSPTIQTFVHEYRLRYGNLNPDAHAALAYDAMRLLAEGIQKAGTDSQKLRDALAQTRNFAGVTGVISMDPNRNAVKPAVVLKLHDGQYLYQETISPADNSSQLGSRSSSSPANQKQ